MNPSRSPISASPTAETHLWGVSVGAAGASRTLRHTRRLRDESATRIIQLKIVPAPEEVEVFQHKRTCKLDITAESVTARADLPPPFIWRLLRRCSATRFAPGMTENISTAFSCQRLRLPLQSRQRAVLDGWDPGGYERASVVTEASRRRILSALSDCVFLPVGGEEPADSRLHLEGKNEPSKDADNGGTQNSRTRVPTY